MRATPGHPPNEFYDQVAPQTVMIPTSKELWTSVRCARMRTYLLNHKLPHFVTGIDGTVSVEFTAEGYVISSEQQREGQRFSPQTR